MAAALTASEQTVEQLKTVGRLDGALLRCLQTLEHLAGDTLDATPAVRQAVTVTLADVRDLAEGDPAAAPLTDQAPDAPWPSEDPRPDLTEET